MSNHLGPKCAVSQLREVLSVFWLARTYLSCGFYRSSEAMGAASFSKISASFKLPPKAKSGMALPSPQPLPFENVDVLFGGCPCRGPS